MAANLEITAVTDWSKEPDTELIPRPGAPELLEGIARFLEAPTDHLHAGLANRVAVYAGIGEGVVADRIAKLLVHLAHRWNAQKR